VELLEPLLFVFEWLLEQCARAENARFAIAEVKSRLRSNGTTLATRNQSFISQTLRPPGTGANSKFLLKLLPARSEKHPPSLPVRPSAFWRFRESTLAAARTFLPLSPMRSVLKSPCAHSKNSGGRNRVGAPVLLDTHNPNSFQQTGFVLRNEESRRSRKDKQRQRCECSGSASGDS